MNKKSIKDVEVKGKRVFCRVDFNVQWKMEKLPMKRVFVQQFQRFNICQEQGAKVIFASHLGRPKGASGGRTSS